MSHPPQDAYNLPLPFGLHRITQALNALGTLLIIKRAERIQPDSLQYV